MLSDLNWEHNNSLYVGDSHNDLEAAEANNIDFIGRYSGLTDWKSRGTPFVTDLNFLYDAMH